jgi:3' exoribonuclease, RNase T-like
MDIMIDLETLGTTSECVVVSLGAAAFNIETQKIESTFHMILELQDQLDRGRKIQADTLKFWFRQEDAAKKIFHEMAKQPTMVLNTFANWIKTVAPNSKELKVWGNGSSFDISIMESMYQTYNIKTPWPYNGVMDLRTFRRFCANNDKIQNMGTKHNALDDATSQAEFVMKYLKYLKPQDLSDLKAKTDAVVAKFIP